MANKRKKPDAVLSAILPRVRVYPSERQRAIHTATAQRISLSDFIRNAVLSAIPAPINSQSLPDLELPATTENLAGRAQVSESQSNISRARLCIHGFRVQRKSTQCSICSSIGIQYKYQYD